MKKSILIALMVLGFASVSNATILFNGSATANITASALEAVGGSNILSIPLITITTNDGGTIASVTAQIESANGTIVGVPVVDYTFAWAAGGNTPGFGAIPGAVVTGSTPTGFISLGTISGLALSSATIQFALTTAYDASNPGGASTSGATSTILITATENPLGGGGVPEPATLGLVGGALLGLGALSRRKRRS